MRQRLQNQQKPVSKWHLKRITGGLTDIDLLIQAWRLEHGALFSDSGQTAYVIVQTLHENGVIDSNNLEQMTDAAQFLNDIYHSLRLTLGPAAPIADSLPHGLHNFLLKRLELPDRTQFQQHFHLSLSTVTQAIEAYLAAANKMS